MTMVPSDDVEAVVIGAGPAGLATSRELARRRIRHLVVERGDAVGHSWRNAYDSLTLHTGKHLSALPGLAFGRRAPLFVHRNRFIEYLEYYAARFSLPVVTGSAVQRAERQDGRWVLQTGTGQLRTRALVLATGIMPNPWRPAIPGQESFRGRVLHSVEYRRPNPFTGRRVLVVGIGNSAAEIASELASAGVNVTLSARGGVHVVPLRLLGIPIQYLAAIAVRLPPRPRGGIVDAVRCLTDLRRGPPVLPRPASSPLESIPIIGFHLPDAIEQGLIRLEGPVAGLLPDGVRFANGTERTVDDVILATGFRAAVAPVRHAVRLDDRGFVRRRTRVVAEGPPGLFVVGHNYDATGGLFNIRRDAPQAARQVADFLA